MRRWAIVAALVAATLLTPLLVKGPNGEPTPAVAAAEVEAFCDAFDRPGWGVEGEVQSVIEGIHAAGGSDADVSAYLSTALQAADRGCPHHTQTLEAWLDGYCRFTDLTVCEP